MHIARTECRGMTHTNNTKIYISTIRLTRTSKIVVTTSESDLAKVKLRFVEFYWNLNRVDITSLVSTRRIYDE